MSVALIILGWTSFETTPDPITDGNSTLPIRHFDDIQDGNRIWITLRTILAPRKTYFKVMDDDLFKKLCFTN